MNKPFKSHVFRGKRYTIKMVPPSKIKHAYGDCDSPNKKCKTIRFDNALTGLIELDTYVHEAVHCSVWDLDEEAVTEIASDISKFLWKLGYRKIDA